MTLRDRARRLIQPPAERLLHRLGLERRRAEQLTDPGQRVVAYPPDYDQETRDLFETVKPYTLTSHERVNALRLAVRYLVDAEVPGAMLECGVWRGGSMLAIALTLLSCGDTSRDLYLFDTFTTMPRPGPHDFDVHGTHVSEYYDAQVAMPYFRYLPQQAVEDLLRASGYPPEKLHFVKGMVEDTIPDNAPDAIALCRLDTDLYASTAHEMKHLFPRISRRGILLIDDYGEFRGARKAVDEYLEEHQVPLLLNRIDQGGRLAVVP